MAKKGAKCSVFKVGHVRGHARRQCKKYKGS